MPQKASALDPEEYIEQAYLFKTLLDRSSDNVPLQDLLATCRDEVLSTTKLPMAIDFMLSEVRHAGTLSTAMSRLPHYFSAFQTYVIDEAEQERGRFDMQTAFAVLRREAEYLSINATTQGIFLYQFEALCRNRLRYDPGLLAMSADPAYDEHWSQWILIVRRQVGLIDIADLIYVRSEYYIAQSKKRGQPKPDDGPAILFGEKEGRIACANRRKDPLYLFASLQRQLGYPVVPRLKKADTTLEMIPQLLRRLERLELRVKLVEEEQRGGIDITKFYGKENADKEEN